RALAGRYRVRGAAITGVVAGSLRAAVHVIRHIDSPCAVVRSPRPTGIHSTRGARRCPLRAARTADLREADCGWELTRSGPMCSSARRAAGSREPALLRFPPDRDLVAIWIEKVGEPALSILFGRGWRDPVALQRLQAAFKVFNGKYDR